MVRINSNRIQTIFNQNQDIQKLIKTASDRMFAVCPFTIVLGALNTTEAGYKPPNLIVNNYTNFQKVFTGRESVLCVWDDCYELDQVRTPVDKGGNETNNYGTVKIKQYEDGSNGGRRYYGRIAQSAVSTSFKPAPGNDSMTAMSATKTVQLIFSYEGNENLFNELTNNIYKFWMIPELFEFKDSKGGGYLSTDRQWYYLENCIVIYDSNTKKPEVLQTTFISANDVISKSGLAINQYIQVSAPGDRCCVPTVQNKLIVCDKEYLKYRPITHVQISLFGNVAFSSIVFMGRPATVSQVQTEWKIEAPRFIFPHKYQASSYDELFVNAVPETNYYLVINAMPTIIEGFEDWKDKISSTYNQFMSKTYEGFLSVNVDSTIATNQDKGVGGGLHYQYWDPRFLQDRNIWPRNEYNVSGSEYYNINPNKQDETINFDFCGETKIVPPATFSDTNYSLALLNLSAFFIQKQFYQLPLEVTQTTPVAVSSIPIIGQYLNNLLMGLPFGFRLTSNVLTPRIPAVLCLFSCEQFELLANIFSTTSKNKIPFDVFRKDTSADIYSMCGTTSQTTSFCFNLSNRLVIRPTKIDGVIPDYKKISHVNYNDKTTIDSVKLGQIDKSKMEAYLLGGILDLETLQVNNGFVIDSFAFQAIGQVPYRITFYSQPGNPQGNLDNKNAVWTGIYKTLSTASQNTRQWTNFMVLSNPQYKFKENFYYPQNVEGAPIEGTYEKDITVYLERFAFIRWVLKDQDPVLINYLATNTTTEGWHDGFVCNLANHDVDNGQRSFEIHDEELGLEHYKPVSATITLNSMIGKVFTQQVINWGGGEQNLSKGGDYYIYYYVYDEGYPFWAQDPGKNGEKLKLNLPVIEEQNIIIDFSNSDDQIIDLSSSNNVLNNDSNYRNYGPVPKIYNFDKNNWNFNGEYLKVAINHVSGGDFIVRSSNSGVNIYFKEISNPTLTIKKTRDEANKKWIITLNFTGTISCNGECLVSFDNLKVAPEVNVFDTLMRYYIKKQDPGINTMSYGVITKNLDNFIKPKVSVKYKTESK